MDVLLRHLFKVDRAGVSRWCHNMTSEFGVPAIGVVRLLVVDCLVYGICLGGLGVHGICAADDASIATFLCSTSITLNLPSFPPFPRRRAGLTTGGGITAMTR